MLCNRSTSHRTHCVVVFYRFFFVSVSFIVVWFNHHLLLAFESYRLVGVFFCCRCVSLDVLKMIHFYCVSSSSFAHTYTWQNGRLKMVSIFFLLRRVVAANGSIRLMDFDSPSHVTMNNDFDGFTNEQSAFLNILYASVWERNQLKTKTELWKQMAFVIGSHSYFARSVWIVLKNCCSLHTEKASEIKSIKYAIQCFIHTLDYNVELQTKSEKNTPPDNESRL